MSEKRKKYLTEFDQRAPIIGEGVRREFCKRIARGEGIKAICKTPEMPSESEFYDLLWRDPDFEKMYRKARLARAEVVAERMRDMAETAKDFKDVTEKQSMAYVQAVRLQVDTDKWLLSKLLPHLYGDELPPSGTRAVEGVLEIIKAVASLAKDPPATKAEVIDVPVVKGAEKLLPA